MPVSLSLRAKLLLPLLLVAILMGSYLYGVWIPRTLAADEVAHLKAVDQHLDSVVEGLIPLLLGNQLDVINENLNALKQKNAAWVAIQLINANGKPIYPLAGSRTHPTTPPGPDVRTLRKPIRYLDLDLGTLTVQVDLAPALANTHRESRSLTIMLFIMLAAVMGTTVLTAELAVRKPVQQLVEASRHLAQQDFDISLPKAGHDEVGALVGSFAAMRNDLRSYHAELLREIAERTAAQGALKKLNETLEQRIQEEAAKNREKDHLLIQQSRLAAMGEMVHNIAHQWRQPLNSLSLLISNVRDDFKFGTITAETLEQDMTTAKRLIEKMSTTIDDFRDFFRPDREKTSFDVAESVKDAAFIVEAAIKNNRIDMAVDAAPGLSVTGFPNQYAQAVLNLLANAKEAIVENKIANGQIRVQLRKADDSAVLTVEDNGGGIPDDVLPKLFDPYFTTKEQGSGIGLYMVKMIIERNMGGSVAAANIENGARFTLSVPLDQGN